MVSWWFHLRVGVGIGANEPDQKLWGNCGLSISVGVGW